MPGRKKQQNQADPNHSALLEDEAFLEEFGPELEEDQQSVASMPLPSSAGNAAGLAGGGLVMVPSNEGIGLEIEQEQEAPQDQIQQAEPEQLQEQPQQIDVPQILPQNEAPQNEEPGNEAPQEEGGGKQEPLSLTEAFFKIRSDLGSVFGMQEVRKSDGEIRRIIDEKLAARVEMGEREYSDADISMLRAWLRKEREVMQSGDVPWLMKAGPVPQGEPEPDEHELLGWNEVPEEEPQKDIAQEEKKPEEKKPEEIKLEDKTEEAIEPVAPGQEVNVRLVPVKEALPQQGEAKNVPQQEDQVQPPHSEEEKVEISHNIIISGFNSDGSLPEYNGMKERDDDLISNGSEKSGSSGSSSGSSSSGWSDSRSSNDLFDDEDDLIIRPMQDRRAMREKLKEAAAAFEKFKTRQQKNAFYTAKQLEDRKKQFLDNYAGLFDDYLRQEGRGNPWEKLPSEAYGIATEIALTFPESYTQRILKQRRIPMGGRINAGRKTRAGIDLKTRVEVTHEARQAEKAVDDRTYFEGERKETRQEKGLKKGLTDAQMRGIRAVSAWMYQNTKKHAHFVEGIDNRSPREKLLIFYIVEKEKKGSVSRADILASQSGYIPNADTFASKVKYCKHWYKFGVKNVNWDMISDAAAVAASVRGLMSSVGEALESDRQSGRGGRRPDKDEAKRILIMEKDKEEKELLSESSDGLSVKGGEEEDEDLIIRKETNVRFNRIFSMAKTMLKGSGVDKKIEEDDEDNKIDAGISRATLQDLEAELGSLQNFLKENGVDENLEGYEENAPAEDTGLKRLAVGMEKRNKYLSLVQAFCNADLKVLSGLQENHIEGLGNAVAGFQWETMGGDAAMTVINLLLSIVNMRNILAAYGTEQGEEMFLRALDLIQTVGNTGKSGLTATTGMAGLAFGADWGLNGTSATAGTLSTAGAGAGIVLGSLTFAIGAGKMITAGQRRGETTSVEQRLQERREGHENDPMEGKRQILQNVVNANRAAQKRTQGSAAMQMVQGGLNTAAGAMALSAGATLGVTGAVAIGLSGLAMVIGIGNVIHQKRAKSKEIADVIDCYLDMDHLYIDFMNRQRRKKSKKEDERILKKFGGPAKIREMLRKESEATLGYPSHEKMYFAIMWKYANTLYDMVFKKNGRVMTAAQKEAEDREDKKASAERKLFADMLRAYGFKIKYPGKPGEEPKPTLNAVYKKLIA